MTMNPSLKHRVMKWLDDSGASPVTCPICKSADWDVHSHVVAAPLVDAETSRANVLLTEGGMVQHNLPMVALICNNCANVTLLGAKRIGLMG